MPHVTREAPRTSFRLWPGRRVALAIAPVFLVIAGCAGGDDGAEQLVSRTDSAGVAIVVNHGPDRPVPFALERTVTIAGGDAGQDPFGNLWERSVATDAAGNIHVLDAQNHRMHMYDTTGAHIRVVGREGGGPGEFRNPSELTVGSDGSAHVFDWGKGGLVHFAADGTGTDEPNAHGASRASVRRIAFDGEWRYVEAEDSGPPPGIPTGAIGPEPARAAIAPEGMSRRIVTARRGATSDTLATSDRPLHPMRQVPGCQVSVSLGPIFEPEFAWAAGGGRLAYVDGSAYRVDLVDSTRRRTSIRRDIPARPGSQALAEQEVGEFTVRWPGGGCTATAAAVVEQRGHAAIIPAVRSMIVAPDGSVWVKRFAVRDDTAAVDVFDPDGAYVGTLPHGSPFPAAFLPNGNVVVVGRDELDVSRVEVWRVARTGATQGNDESSPD